LKKDSCGDQFLSVPSPFTWSKPKPGHTPIFRTSSLPPLDWPLPAHFGQCELKIEVQPKTHHRAHYETEGSRGAVKASTGGHPVVKESKIRSSFDVVFDAQLLLSMGKKKVYGKHSRYLTTLTWKLLSIITTYNFLATSSHMALLTCRSTGKSSPWLGSLSSSKLCIL
ncbi:nuclear factor of activated T cells 3, partial [Homo sapiens]